MYFFPLYDEFRVIISSIIYTCIFILYHPDITPVYLINLLSCGIFIFLETFPLLLPLRSTRGRSRNCDTSRGGEGCSCCAWTSEGFQRQNAQGILDKFVCLCVCLSNRIKSYATCGVSLWSFCSITPHEYTSSHFFTQTALFFLSFSVRGFKMV